MGELSTVREWDFAVGAQKDRLTVGQASL